MNNNNLINEWDAAPLLRAGTNVVDTATKLRSEAPCQLPEWTLRFNVANIHEIKKIWGEPTQD
ncbi:hypothetical protein HU762_10570 [Pseudomonas sp. SWRI92]|uniref:hypothetical protein n=1 Tax=Pseudomonas sp. SWRI92 TaxID=2745499 RepID=UPI00164539D9|nr:hypothetical protein [Pseudomonas sp. SWRI92]MBC3374382.1 hypothetical protein [Pseudomonas sp. SWRI92]